MRTTRSENSTKIQRRARNPALVSCSTSSGTSRRTPPLTGSGLLGSEHQAGVTHPDHVTVVELPGLDRVAVHGGPVRGSQVRQRGLVPVPADLEVATGDTGVRQPEGGVLAAADDVRALGQLVAAPRAVVHADAGRELLLVAAAPAALLLAVAVLVVAAVVALVVGLLVAALLAVALLAAVALVVAGLRITGLRVGLLAAVAATLLLAVSLVVALGTAVPALLAVAALLGLAAVTLLALLPPVALALLVSRLLAVAALLGLAVTLLRAVAVGLALVVLAPALVVTALGVGLLAVSGVATVVAVVAVLLGVGLLAHGFSCVACSHGVPAGSIGVDGRAGAELSRVQRLGALQEDYDLTEGVQPLVGEVSGDSAGQVVDDPCHVVARDAVEILWAEHHGESVRRQLAPSRELLDLVFGFPLQRAFDLLGNDAASEDPRGSVAHHPLETALEPPDAAHRSSSVRIGVLLGVSDRIRASHGGGPRPGTPVR